MITNARALVKKGKRGHFKPKEKVFNVLITQL